MLTPEEIKQLPLPIITLFNGLENEVVTNLADRLKFVGELNESERYRYKALNDYIDLENRFNNLKMDFDKQTQKEVDSLLEESARQCYLDDVGRYRLANKGLIHYYRNRRVQQFVDGIKLSTKGEFSNLARGMVLYDVDGKPHALNKVFSKTIDQAIFYSASGVYSYQEMAKRAIEVASKRGLCTIQGESGRVLRVDGYANLLLRTGLGRITNEITTLNLEQTGECYVEVSAHLGARPSHADWQGQIYYWQDKDTIGDNNSAGYPEFIASTGYGTGEGLGGYNCRHSFYPFFVGVSKPAYSKEELDNFDKENYTYKGKIYTTYDVTQKQRNFERAIRESKLKILGYRNLGDNDASLYESVRLRRLQDEYKGFSQATNSRAKLERTGVVGYNRSVSDKVVKKEKFVKDNRYTPMNLQLFNNKISDDKFIKYALNPEKAPDKALAFELALGYTIDNFEKLKANIYKNLKEDNFIEKGDNGFGMRYEQLLFLTGENGKSAYVMTAWIQDGEDKRLTSLYITKRRRKR